jgi:hypothetical protein
LAGRRTQVFREQTLELARRKQDRCRDFLHGSRLIVRSFHHGNCRDQFFVGHAEPALDGHPLQILRSSDARMNELLRDVVG